MQFIDGSAFEDMELKSIPIEAGNDIFHTEHEFLIDIVHHKLIRNFSVSSKIEILRIIKILGSSSFSYCKLFSSISFDSNSGSKLIESYAFLRSSLQSIEILRSVEILCSSYFSSCESLSSISFETNSELKWIEALSLNGRYVHSIVILSTICLIASTAFHHQCQISLLDGSSCPEFERWLAVRRLESNVDFRRIQKLSSGLHRLSDCVVDLSGFEGADEIGVGGTGSAHLYRRCEDGFEIVVKLFGEFDPGESCEIEREIEKLMNVTHPCIAAPFGLVLPAASKELRIARSYTRSSSLKDVLLARPLWWMPTAKAIAIAIAGIVLGMKFLHSFGLIHGGLKPSNVLFDEHHRIQIADFGQSPLDPRESAGTARGVASELAAREMLSSEERTAKIGVFSFALILFEIMVDLPALGRTSIVWSESTCPSPV
jgi:hypothetical protein